jgi:hypothetical protein
VDSRINPDPVRKIEKKSEGRREIKINPVSTSCRMALVDDVLAIDGARVLSSKIVVPAYVDTV